MPKLTLSRAANLLVPADPDSESAIRSLPYDQEFSVNIAHAREPRRHRFLFALIDIGFENWPHHHMFKPHDSEHLRAWLLCEAGHCQTTIVGITRQQDMLSAAAALTEAMATSAQRKHRLVDSDGYGLRLRIPKSIAYANCDEREFYPLMMAIAGIVESAIGVPVAELLLQASTRSGQPVPQPDTTTAAA